MRAEQRRIGRWWRLTRRRGLAGLQCRSVAQYRRDEKRLIRMYGAFPQRWILGADGQLPEYSRRWLDGENPDVSGRYFISPVHQVRATTASAWAAVAFLARVAAERTGATYLLPRAGARRQLLHQGRAPKGRR